MLDSVGITAGLHQTLQNDLRALALETIAACTAAQPDHMFLMKADKCAKQSTTPVT